MGRAKNACYTCGATLNSGDYKEGRAVSLLGRPFCDKCVERATELSRPGALESQTAHRKQGETNFPPPAPPEDPFERSPEEMEEIRRRTQERKAPPSGCRLYLKKTGFRGFFGGNAVILWLDVSSRGGRAIMKGSFASGDAISLWIIHKAWGQRLEADATIKHVSPSEQYPGSSLIGFRFENRSAALAEFLTKLIRKSGGDSPSRCLRGKLA